MAAGRVDRPGRRQIRVLGWVGFAGAVALLVTTWAVVQTTSGDGPWGMVPGGALRGPARPCPARWEGRGPTELEVETRPDRPRSVTTWSVTLGGGLFVPADFLTPWKRWPYDAVADDRARLRVAGEIFECRLRRVDDLSRISLLRRETAAKYEIDPEGWAARSEVWWFEVGPR